MTAAIAARGPDDSGEWFDRQAGMALGHRRLSIIERTREGHQPMVSASGQFVISYNGEIYNHSDLRADLMSTGETFRGYSDTETLLSAIARWGVEDTLPKLNGMFAFALWDRSARTLHLCRDRLGEKPLYYGWTTGSFVFASELKSLDIHSEVIGDIDREALASYFRLGFVSGPDSICAGIRRLPPGSHLVLSNPNIQEEIAPRSYWSGIAAARTGMERPYLGTTQGAVDAVDQLLHDAVSIRMAADVPLGAFLSGGVDSSLIVGLMQRDSSHPVSTFTVGFEDSDFDETIHARAIAKHFGTAHTEVVLSTKDALAIIPTMGEVYDEPFSDSSQVPTALVAQVARRHVTVALSGDGGDELFGGYSRYLRAAHSWRSIRHIPHRARRIAASGLGRLPASVVHQLEKLLPRGATSRALSHQIKRLIEILPATSRADFYARIMSHGRSEERVVLDGEPRSRCATSDGSELFDFMNWMMANDLVGYLPDDILTKLDRATMAFGLEARVPMLDYRLVELAWQLPASLRVSEMQTKWIIREVLARYAPANLFDRPKKGFEAPIGAWLRGPLKEWAESLLTERRLRQEGYLNVPLVRQRWEEHLSGRRDWQYEVWDVLMFESWIDAKHSRRRFGT